jgi:hypothetical protein
MILESYARAWKREPATILDLYLWKYNLFGYPSL